MPWPLVDHIIEDCDSIADAEARYAEEVAALEGTDFEAWLTLRAMQAGSDQTLREIADGLSGQEHLFGLRRGALRQKVVVLVGQTAQGFRICRKRDAAAVLIDGTLLTLLTSVVVMAGLRRGGRRAEQLCAAFFLIVMQGREAEIAPYASAIQRHVSRLDRAVYWDTFGTVADLVLCHEVGHLYCDEAGRDFVRMLFADPARTDISGWHRAHYRAGRTGHLYEVAVTPDHPEPRLAFQDRVAHWLDEFAPDVFALIATFLVFQERYGRDAQGHRIAVEAFLDGFTTWQLTFYLLGLRQEAQRHKLFPDPKDRSHPDGRTRAAVILFHLETIGRALAPGHRGDAMARMLDHFDAIWSTGLQAAADRALAYARHSVPVAASHGHLFDLPQGQTGPGLWEAFEALALHPPLAVADFYPALGEDHGPDTLLVALGERGRDFDQFFEACQDRDGAVLDALADAIQRIPLHFHSEPRRP